MELDELKKTWKQADNNKLKTKDVMELIQHKSYGPIAALKKAFKKQMRLMAIIPALLFLSNADDVSKVLTSFMFWSYVAFCAAVVVFSYYNYRIVEKMEGMDKMVKSNLEEQIHLLEKRMDWNTIGLRITLIYFIFLTEIVPYFQHYSMLDKWHSANPFLRYGCYTVLLLMQYFLSRNIWDRKFGSHLKYLKGLVKEMGD